MPHSTESWAQNDIDFHLHSYTDARAHQEKGPLIIERGDGVYVIDNQGNRYLEGMAGLWSTALGFSEERLVAAYGPSANIGRAPLETRLLTSLQHKEISKQSRNLRQPGPLPDRPPPLQYRKIMKGH